MEVRVPDAMRHEVTLRGTHRRLDPDQQRTTEPVLGPRGARTRVQVRRAAQYPGTGSGAGYFAGGSPSRSAACTFAMVAVQ